MTQISNVFARIAARDQWERDPNPLYPMTFVNLFDVGTDHQTTMMCIQPGMQQHLHYHEAGGDIFLVLQGAGTLVTAELSADKSKHVNEINQAVKAGDLYSIKPFEVHSLKNIGNEDLVILNIAPSSHGDTDLIEVD